MISGAGAVADIGEHGAQSLMRLHVIRIDPQGRLVMLARFGVLVGAKQQVCQVDMSHRIGGMVDDRLGIDPAGRVDRAIPSAGRRIR